MRGGGQGRVWAYWTAFCCGRGRVSTEPHATLTCVGHTMAPAASNGSQQPRTQQQGSRAGQAPPPARVPRACLYAPTLRLSLVGLGSARKASLMPRTGAGGPWGMVCCWGKGAAGRVGAKRRSRFQACGLFGGRLCLEKRACPRGPHLPCALMAQCQSEASRRRALLPSPNRSPAGRPGRSSLRVRAPACAPRRQRGTRARRGLALGRGGGPWWVWWMGVWGADSD
mgnify:CR=1 FL=1